MPRVQILTTYSEWTALSAMRSKAPIKSRNEIYPLLRGITFAQVADLSKGPIVCTEFDEWHRDAVETLMQRERRLEQQAGWAAKLLNVYLKTFAYVGDAGRPLIRDCLHPPIDRGLWKSVEQRFRGDRAILDDTHCVSAISGITTYDTYRRIVKGMRLAAKKLGCSLIEVEQLWDPMMGLARR